MTRFDGLRCIDVMKRFVMCAAVCGLLLRSAWAVDSVVVFNEIHYHPATNEAASEWVELHNQMAIDIDLSAWSVKGDINFTFGDGTIIPGGGHLVVAIDPGALRAATGITNVVGPFTGRLNNSLGVLELRDRNNRLMDEVEYRDGGKWPAAPDGSGATLAKREPNATSAEPEHWTSSVLAGGTPGGRNFPAAPLVQRRTLIPFNALWRFEASGTDLGSAWRTTTFDDTAWSGKNNATLVSYWPFDGDATAVRGINGTFVGSVASTNDRNGTPGGALAFNGALSQYVSVTGGGGLNGALFGTISMWVKWTGTQDTGFGGAAGAVLGRQQNGAFSDDIISLNNANPDLAVVQWRQNAAGTINAASSGIISNGVWRHIAITFTEASSQVFVDGALQGSGGGGALHNNAATVLAIGAWAGDGGSFCSASIDDVAIWDQPLTSAQIAQIAAQTKTPLDFAAPESAIYFAGDGRLTSNDELRRTMLPLGPNTYYFRTAFVFNDDPARTQLGLDLALDDGAVFYLNGAEVYRHNMPGGSINYATLAAAPVADAPILNGIAIPGTNLVQGTNLLAVEVHQSVVSDAGMVFGAGLNAVVAPAPPVEERPLITRNDVWKFDASNVDRGTAWRAAPYDDATWASGDALFYAGDGDVSGVAPERVTPLSATPSSQYSDRLAVHTINGSGLVGNAHVNTPSGTMWLNNGTFVAPNDLNPQITFDLGAAVPLRWMKVWNYNEDLPGRPELLARGVASGDILVGITNGVLTNFITGQAFNKAPGTQTDFSQIIEMGGINSRYVKLDKLTNFPGGDLRFVGLSEVQFFRDADLLRTQLPLGTATYYFRKTFNFGGDPSHATLFINAAVDDGAVFYLNGVEIHRMNLPAGAVNHSTMATNVPGPATFTGWFEVPSANLVRGSNVLAVEVHMSPPAGALDDMVFGMELKASVTVPDPVEFDPGTLVFNEVRAASTNAFQIELVNQGTAPINVGGYVVARTGTSPDAEFTLPPQMLGPGAFLVLSQGTLGFGAVAGDKLILYRPAKTGIADSVEVHERARGRSPDGTGEWATPGTFTPGSSNSFAFHDDIVINEIMYHGPPTLELPAVIGTNTILTFSNVWRYEQSGVDLGTTWRTAAYDDAGWLVGTGLFYNTASALPAPKNTPLVLSNAADAPITTYYFRTTFVYTGAPAILSMTMRHIMDDGIVLYLNGTEIHRFNMGNGAVSYTNTAPQTILNATIRNVTGGVSLTNLVLGTNVLAAEVHQAAASGNDVAFGAELTAVVEAIPRVPYSESPEQWVELFNRGTNAVDLTGWRLDEAVDFRFASNTMIPAGGYLVVAKDPGALRAEFPGVTVTGPYTNSLSRRGDRVVIKDANDNIADLVHYFDDGRWPQAPDGGGASLELRDPWADNAAGEAWAASDERARTAWRTYSYRGIAAASPVGPDGQWHEFVMGFLDAGEALLDDIMVVETPATTPTNLIQNSTFDTGTNKWRIIGNHHGEVIDDPDQPGNKVLRLVANGSTDHMNNHAETTFVGNRDVVNGREYLITFRAKWISGSRQLLSRLYFNRLPRTTLLDAPLLHGTPGAQNSTFTTNIGPTYAELRHQPVVPGSFEPVTVSVRAGDPDGVSGLTLWTRVEGGSWNSAPMSVSSDGIYSGVVPGKLAGTVVQFYVQGTDELAATSTFPAGGTNSRAFYKVDDGLAATNGLHNIRLITLAAESDEMLRTVNLMSNERIGTTLIYDDREVFYDVGLRLKGSEHSRTTTPRLGFNVSFSSEQLFRGVHSTVAIDRSESTGFGQREMLIHQTLNHAGGVPTKYHDLVQVMAPRPEHTGTAELQLARYSDVFLDDQYENGSDGMVFEYELVYQLNSTDNGTPEGNKVAAPDSVTGTAIRNLGDDKEGYRWTFLIKNNEERDDYSRVIPFAKWMEQTGAAFTGQITNYIDVEQWLRGVAVNALSGAGDSYGGDGAQHNVQFYVRPTDGRMLYFPHDIDAFFSATRPIVPNGDVSKMLAVPAYARAYYGHLLDIIATTYNASYMTRWANHFGRLLPAQPFASHLAFLIQRSDFVVAQVNTAVPNIGFAITSNSGNNFGTSNNTITLTGTAPLAVKFIEVNGVSYPITWTSTTAWSLTVPLFSGPNALTAQGMSVGGVALTNAIDTITITNSGSGAPLPVMINEWMADNAAPGGLSDPVDGLNQDWFELYNPNTNAFNLSGFFLTDDLSQPTKSPIPTNTIIAAGGFLLVWADNQVAQNGLSPFGDLHAAFQLNNGGEVIALLAPDGTIQSSVEFGPQIQNVSQGLFADGSTNGIFHFMTNFTPRAANSLAAGTTTFPITLVIATNGTVRFAWEAIAGRTYRVEFKNDLNEPAWAPLGVEMTASTTTAAATNVINAGQRFYRVQLVQ